MGLSWLPLLLLVIGIVNCFFGYRIFHIVLAFWGFIGAFVLVYGSTNEILLGLAAAIIGAVLARTLYSIGVFVAGTLFGYMLAAVLLGLLGLSVPLASFLIGIAFGLLSVRLIKPFVIISTSFNGAYSIVLGLMFLLTDIPFIFTPWLMFGLLPPGAWMACFVLAIIGMLYQFGGVSGMQRAFRQGRMRMEEESLAMRG